MLELVAGLVLLTLIAAPVIVLLVLGVRAFSRLRRLEEELHRLDAEVQELRLDRLPTVASEEPPGAEPEAEIAPATPPVTAAEPPPPIAAALSPPTRPEPEPELEPEPPTPAEALSPAGWEERVGSRLFVWIGAIALALAAAVLVQYSLEQGWLSPAVRVTLGLIAGVLFLAGGEWLRASSPEVAKGLSAAGIAALFVSFYAAVELYALLPAAVGFGLLALTTAAAVLLSLRQGVIVAGIGLVGGFLSPSLVSVDQPRPAVLFAYLLLLQAGLVTVSRHRRWGPLGVLTLAGGLLWAAAYLAGPFRLQDSPWIGLFVLASAAVFVASGAPFRQDRGWGSAFLAGLLGWASVGGSLFVLAALVHRSGYGPFEWAFLALLSAGCLLLARWQARFHGLAWLAALVVASMLAVWWLGAPPAPRTVVWVAAGFGGLFALGAAVARLRSSHPGRWAALSVTAALVFFLLAFGAGQEIEAPIPWGVSAVLLAALATAAAVAEARRREGDGVEEALAAWCVGATTFVSLAVPLELARQWLTVAWALEVLALVWLGGKVRVPVLQRLAGLMVGLVAVRLLLNPAVLDYPTGAHPVFNWLLYGYGLPAVALAVAARLAARRRSVQLSDALLGVAAALLFGYVTLEVRQVFHPGQLRASPIAFAEWGGFTVGWLLLAWGLLAAWRRWPRPPLRWGGRLLLGLALLQGLLAQGIVLNPAWTSVAVGTLPVLNRLLWVYGGPLVLLMVIKRELSAQGARVSPFVAAIGALGFGFILLTLEVRQLYRGDVLTAGTGTSAEGYAYSIAWILLGTGLLIAAILRRSPTLRYASLAVMLPAVLKVFLYDTANLQGLYRAVSLFGLGLALLLLAYLYQRFVFRGER